MTARAAILMAAALLAAAVAPSEAADADPAGAAPAALVRAAAPARAAVPVAASAPVAATPGPDAPSLPSAEPEDEALEQRLRRAFAVVEGLHGITPTARAGVVRLTGTVATGADAGDAAEIASRTPGVVHVADALKLPANHVVSPDAERDDAITASLLAVFTDVEDLDGITVEVAAGVVRLRGEAPSDEAVRRAAELARGLPGVVYVDSKVQTPTGVTSRVGVVVESLRSLATRGLSLLPNLAVAAIVLLLVFLLARGIRTWRLPFRKVSEAPLMQGVARQVAAVAVVVVGLVLSLQLLGATALVGAVLGTAGLAGIAVGFAFRDIAENYLASLILGAWRPFAANDHVIVGSHEGKVMRLTTRETVLLTLDGNHLRIPNAIVFKSVILNYTRNPLRRFHFKVGVGTGEDLSRAQRLGIETLALVPGVLADPPPFARIEELADFNVVMQFFGWVDQRHVDHYKVKSEAVRRLKAAFDEAGVDMPVPLRDVRLRSAGGEAGFAGEGESKPGRHELVLAGPAEPAGAERVDSEEVQVQVDDVLERQIADDRRHSADEDLLDDPGTGNPSPSPSPSPAPSPGGGEARRRA